ncbi:MAG: DNA polymerase III subunit gamma/tau [Candidatus Levybacteria bacterium]|nr:DNA polymerase III subunit gamma/tau [Candidatus Levybacteria bacterium]
MVFYRKYRPQKIGELDSEAVRNSLYSIFSKKETPHAFLFSGPKGLGKTSAARIIAKVITCEKHKDLKTFKDEKEIEPCNKCSQCESIKEGTNLDVYEIDGASNRGIDEIRDLKEKINLLPTKAFKKIYIIDEVHMLTTEAFNALLKTLEEPPSHAVFILCTTENYKLPKTVVSRCFRVDFKKATDGEIVRSLKRIVKAENIKIQEDVLLEISHLSEGSFRDSVKILEELVLTAGRKTITKGLLSSTYNTLGIEKALDDFINALSKKDTKKSFEIIALLVVGGMDFKFFIEKLIDRFHFMLLVKIGIEENQSDDFTLEEIKKALELLAKVYMDTKFSVLPSLPLELLVVEWGQERSSDLSQSVSEKTEVRQGAVNIKPKQTVNNFSDTFINEVKNHNHLVAGVLRSCEIENGKETLEIYAISKFHKDKLEEQKSMDILLEVANKLLQKETKIHITLRG